jgi:uncharacterized protein YggE
MGIGMSTLRRTTKIFATVAGITCVALSYSAVAQQAPAAPLPQIIVSGSAEVLVPPAKASFSIGIMTSAQSAAAAGEDNARISKGVLAALEHAGLKRDEITGSRLGVRPRWEYDDKGRHPKRSAFEANNMIQIVTDNLTQIGNFIDAALSAGATDASEITFSAKDIDEARRRALGQAVVTARTDAEGMARAGGGALGDLLLLSTERTNEAPGVDLEEIVVTGARRAREAVNTDVIPSQIKVTARVIARWRFVPTPAAK